MLDGDKRGVGLRPKTLAEIESGRPPLPSSQAKSKFYSKRWFKILMILILFLVVAVVSLLAYVYWQAESIIDDFSEGPKKQVIEQAKPELGVKPKKVFPGLKDVETYLLLGSDVRTATDPSDPGRTDTILLVRVYPKEKMVSILSLPRDLYIPIPGYGEDRINAAYTYGGVPLLVETIREWLGVGVDHFVQIDFESFADLINELGGAYLPIDQRYLNVNDGSIENDYSEIDLMPGYQKLWGADTLSFVRFRHTDSDFYRAARQQLFLREIGRSLRAKHSVFEYKDLIKTISKGTTTDIDSLPKLLQLANTLKDVPAENIVRTVMPAEGAMINGMSVVVPSESDKETALKDWDNPEKFISQQEKSKRIKWNNQDLLDFLDLTNTLALFTNPDITSLTQRYRESIEKRMARSKARTGSKDKIKESEDKLVSETPPVEIAGDQPFKHCIPEKVPSGYYWPDEDASYHYVLKKKPAQSAYATKSSGVSILWMWTKWDNPTILDAPSDLLAIPGDSREYKLYWESGRVRMIAWQDGSAVSWITNTLQNELDKREMIALATSCK